YCSLDYVAAQAEIYTHSLRDALPISDVAATLLGDMAEGGRRRNGHACGLQGSVKFRVGAQLGDDGHGGFAVDGAGVVGENFLLRSDEHRAELQSRFDLVCCFLLE